jgi:hypothetical protein
MSGLAGMKFRNVEVTGSVMGVTMVLRMRSAPFYCWPVWNVQWVIPLSKGKKLEAPQLIPRPHREAVWATLPQKECFGPSKLIFLGELPQLQRHSSEWMKRSEAGNAQWTSNPLNWVGLPPRLPVKAPLLTDGASGR